MPLKASAKANDQQHGGTHYKDQPIQTWDYIVDNDIDYLEGNAIKYLSRWKQKGGIQDLEKARHYVEKLIEKERAKLPQPASEPEDLGVKRWEVSEAEMLLQLQLYVKERAEKGLGKLPNPNYLLSGTYSFQWRASGFLCCWSLKDGPILAVKGSSYGVSKFYFCPEDSNSELNLDEIREEFPSHAS